MTIDPAKLEQFMGRTLTDLSAMISGLLVHIGDKLGLYKAMAGAGPMTASELARKTGTAERYVREWLSNQAAGGYIQYHAASDRFELTAEAAMCLADEGSPTSFSGAFETIAGLYADEPKVTQAFKTGGGVAWHEHDHRVFSGTERFFRPSYNANLVSSWIPSLEGVQAKLEAGAKCADIGCGFGTSTLLLARSFPASEFHGFDFHELSIDRARTAARAAGLAERVHFEVAGAKTFPGTGYDLIAFFDCLHDLGDPVGALRHVRNALQPDGTVLLVEPFCHDRLEENVGPIARSFYGVSTMLCTPASLSQEVGRALGAQAGEERLRTIAKEAGFTRFRRATATPFNLVLEARP